MNERMLGLIDALLATTLTDDQRAIVGKIREEVAPQPFIPYVRWPEPLGGPRSIDPAWCLCRVGTISGDGTPT